MTNSQMDEGAFTHVAMSLSTQFFLNALIVVLRDDGLITQEQIRRAVAAAKKNLEAQKTPVAIRASVLLEPSAGEI